MTLGHSEYYSSHGTVIENILRSSAGIFLIVINILQKEAIRQLRQWLQVVRNKALTTLEQCQLIVVVSHVDAVDLPIESRRRKEEIQEMMSIGKYVMLYFLIVESSVGETLFPSLTSYLVPVNLFVVDV